MFNNVTTIGFYDAMSVTQVKFIMEQTEIATVTASAKYCKVLLKMKQDGNAPLLKNLVNIDDVTEELTSMAAATGVKLFRYE